MRVMPPPNEQALNAAVDWLVHREASEPSAADREAFQHWLDQDASHRGAWERVNSALAAPPGPRRGRLRPPCAPEGGGGARSPSPMARPCCWMLAPPLMCATWRTCPVCSTRQAH